jgi:hypothetical protein
MTFRITKLSIMTPSMRILDTRTFSTIIALDASAVCHYAGVPSLDCLSILYRYFSKLIYENELRFDYQYLLLSEHSLLSL